MYDLRNVYKHMNTHEVGHRLAVKDENICPERSYKQDSPGF